MKSSSLRTRPCSVSSNADTSTSGIPEPPVQVNTARTDEADTGRLAPLLIAVIGWSRSLAHQSWRHGAGPERGTQLWRDNSPGCARSGEVALGTLGRGDRLVEGLDQRLQPTG